MTRLLLGLIAAIAIVAAQTLFAQTIAYPSAERSALVEEMFGTKVADPYRWLESDLRSDAKVRAWVEAENETTKRYLAALPERDRIRARLKALWRYERTGVPIARAGRLFFTRNPGLLNQSPIFEQDSVTSKPRLLLDPNMLSNDGTRALDDFAVSNDGTHLAYVVEDAGSDWGTVHILDVASGQTAVEVLRWVKFSLLAWAKDGSGLYYSRFPTPSSGREFQSINVNQAVYFHRLGTTQAADQLVYATPDLPSRRHVAQVTADGRWLVITTLEGTDDRYEVVLKDLSKPGSRPWVLFAGLNSSWKLVGSIGDTLTFVTNRGAPHYRIVRVNVATARPVVTELVPENADTIQEAAMVGSELIVSYLHDARSVVRRFDLDGRRKADLQLPGIGTVSGIHGQPERGSMFYSFTSFNQPGAVYRYDATTGRSTVFAQPRLAFRPPDFEIEQRFFASKDGTRVPMFIVRRKGLDPVLPRPTLLTAYGGFNISQPPRFTAPQLAWMEMGGVFALANIRGGGEYGTAWHDGGRLANKQNVFDDFIGAAEMLIGAGITTRRQLAITGRSNGGLLVGAVVNQRPDLFAAAVPSVGVMDMLRFNRFTAGRLWVDDYGDPSRQDDFRTLRAYSPYHNIRGGFGRAYPAILVTTGDTDDRVVPAHSFKYVAALQAAALGDRPHLIRIDTRAGHGEGKPVDKQIDEFTDILTFIAAATGMTGTPSAPSRGAND